MTSSDSLGSKIGGRCK